MMLLSRILLALLALLALTSLTASTDPDAKCRETLAKQVAIQTSLLLEQRKMIDQLTAQVNRSERRYSAQQKSERTRQQALDTFIENNVKKH